MKVSNSFSHGFTRVSQKILAHSTIIAFVLAMSTLIYCVYNIQQILDLPSDEQYRQEQMQKNSTTSFDKTTIDQVKQLRTTTDAPIVLPTGKINPFVE